MPYACPWCGEVRPDSDAHAVRTYAPPRLMPPRRVCTVCYRRHTADGEQLRRYDNEQRGREPLGSRGN